MKIKLVSLLVVCTVSILTACTQSAPKKAIPTKFTLPAIPELLTSQEAKAEFLATHYWDNFDFTDTTLISRADYTEQAFADFINLMNNIPLPIAGRGVDTLMHRAAVDSAMYDKFMSLSEKYLYDPNSPMRNENIYIAVLRNVVANPKLDEVLKIRPQYQLELAMKNRVGEAAADFEFTAENGSKTKLYSVKGDPLMLFFFRPDCPVCRQTKEYIAKKGIDKLVKIVYINPDLDTHLEDIYDLRASPTLYLVDKNKVVVLKDAPIEQIEAYLIRE